MIARQKVHEIFLAANCIRFMFLEREALKSRILGTMLSATIIGAGPNGLSAAIAFATAGISTTGISALLPAASLFY
jgi:hypothetical protein